LVLTLIDMKGFIFLDITLCNLLNVNRYQRQHDPPECQLNFNRLHSIVSQKTEILSLKYSQAIICNSAELKTSVSGSLYLTSSALTFLKSWVQLNTDADDGIRKCYCILSLSKLHILYVNNKFQSFTTVKDLCQAKAWRFIY
jgi:hypothetical protein